MDRRAGTSYWHDFITLVNQSLWQKTNIVAFSKGVRANGKHRHSVFTRAIIPAGFVNSYFRMSMRVIMYWKLERVPGEAIRTTSRCAAG